VSHARLRDIRRAPACEAWSTVNPSEDIRYFRARALEERQRALAAASPAIRAIHLEFALRYEHLAGEMRAADDMQSSHAAVQRSMNLLRTTNELLSENQRS
jgi:hypothetical protein